MAKMYYGAGANVFKWALAFRAYGDFTLNRKKKKGPSMFLIVLHGKTGLPAFCLME